MSGCSNALFFALWEVISNELTNSTLGVIYIFIDESYGPIFFRFFKVFFKVYSVFLIKTYDHKVDVLGLSRPF